MQRRIFHLFAAIAVAAVLLSVNAAAGEVTSRMSSVSGVFESNGYHIRPVFDVSVQGDPRDLTTPQAYEIVRPDMDVPLSVGRLFTSCNCIQLEAQKRTFGPGERAILVLRNIRATPKNGQMYTFFVQLREPVESTLRFDIFVQSGVGIGDQQGAISDVTIPAPVDSEGHRPVGNPAPGANNLLAAALAAVGTQPEATGDLVAEASGESAADQAGDDAAEAEAAAAVTEEPVGEPSPLEPEAQEAALASASPAAGSGLRPPASAVEAADDAEADDVDEPVAEAEALTEDQVFQLQQLALMQAEEQAKQLAERVLQLQANNQADSGGAAEESVAVPEVDAYAAAPVQAISLITIGVGDMAASIRFYEAIGWRRAARDKYVQTAFFQLNGQILALYPIADLLNEQNMAGVRPSPGGITLALHVQRKEDVESVYRRFVEAGGRPLRAPAEMGSGAVSGYVADPDGNPWEISWVPQFTMDADGGLWLP